jgi:tetratricopeptide (TPR) repeat protein
MSLPVEKALRKAQSHIKAGELAEAEELYKQVLSKFPKNKKAILGYQKLKAGVTSKSSSNSEPPQEQVDKLISLYSQGQFEEALEKAKPLISLFPKAVTLHNIQGASNTALQRYDAAIDSYNQAIKIKPDYVDAYYNMGIALKDKGELDAAIDTYKQAIRIKPSYADAYYNMGNALKDKGELDAAIDTYKQAIKIKPDYAIAHYNMGIALKDKGELDAAIESYKQAIKIQPDYSEAYNNMGGALQNQDDLDAAIDSYKQAIKIKPDYAEAYNNMGATLQEQGKLQEAIEAYNKALAIKPDYAEAKHNLVATLKIYSPKNNHRNPLIDLDNKIKAKHNKHALPKADQELAIYISNVLNELQNVDKNFNTKYIQIYRRNNVDLNCKRHTKIFKEKEIIPKFCFGCYKVQVDVSTVLDLIRLAALFYESEFESDLIRKCLVEVRPNIPGFYKGLIYCRGIDQAHSVKAQLDIHVRDIDKNLVAKIKKGCSEFPLAFPKYGEVAASEDEMMQYPEAWRALEVEFDAESPIPPKTYVNSSLKGFCLSDYLIIQKWIDYAKGIGDPTSELFSDFPVKYNEILNLAKVRVKQ